MYLLDKLEMTWQSRAILFWRDFVSLNHLFHVFRSECLLQGKFLETGIFLCSDRQTCTMAFHELHLEIFSYCLPIPQALWPGIAPKGGVTLFLWPALACLRSSLLSCLLQETHSLATGLCRLLSSVSERGFCLCVCVCVSVFAMPYLFLLLHSTLKHCPWGLQHFLCLQCKISLMCMW